MMSVILTVVSPFSCSIQPSVTPRRSVAVQVTVTRSFQLLMVSAAWVRLSRLRSLPARVRTSLNKRAWPQPVKEKLLSGTSGPYLGRFSRQSLIAGLSALAGSSGLGSQATKYAPCCSSLASLRTEASLTTELFNHVGLKPILPASFINDANGVGTAQVRTASAPDCWSFRAYAL